MNGVIALEPASTRLPGPDSWWPCERCTCAGSPSRLDARFCEVCLPDPNIEASRVADAGDRVRRARELAAAADEAGRTPSTYLAVPPDVGHVWLHPSAWGSPHLFHDGEIVSYCRKVATQYPVRTAAARPARQDVEGCRACWRSFQAPHRRAV